MNVRNKIRDWLGVVDAPEATKPDIKQYEKDFAKLKSDLEFWKQQFKKQAPTKKCTKCKGEIDVWPFNTEAYYIKGARVTHQNCPKELK